MDKSILKQLYLRKDRKRKKVLFKIYKDILLMDMSLSYIQDLINKDLDENLVSIQDIKYVRFHFRNLKIKTQSPVVPPNSNPVSKAEITWTSEEEIIGKPSQVKSKFSKK